MRHAIFASFACLSLVACGGDGGLVDNSTPDEIQTLSATDLARRTGATYRRVTSLPGTAFVAMPTSGVATFDGLGTVAVDPDSADAIAVVGDAAMTVDFGARTLRGRIDGLRGLQGDRIADVREVPVDGAITIGGRSAIGQGAPNDASVRYRGDMTFADGRTLDVRGRLDGKFRGTMASKAGTPDAPRALNLGDGSPRLTDGAGRRIPGIVAVAVEN